MCKPSPYLSQGERDGFGNLSHMERDEFGNLSHMERDEFENLSQMERDRSFSFFNHEFTEFT